jgi:hypothetical protein
MIIMVSRTKSVDDVKLSGACTVGKYRLLEKAMSRSEIAVFIEQRFEERYIAPIENSGKRNGFSTMAVSCLMVEALESFWRGWPNTRGRSELAFCAFFQRTPALAVFHGYGPQFYEHVRCGILHQAETTGGWRIQKSGPLFNAASKTVGSDAFLAALRAAINFYATELRQQDWSSEIWTNFRRKMKSICANCE